MEKLRYHNTPETMSMEDAIKLFQPLEDGSIYKSYILMESVIPKEYLDSKEFFKAVIPTRTAITYNTLLSYATNRLKADFELGIMSVEKNVSLDGLYRRITREDYEEMTTEDKKYVLVEETSNPDFILLKSPLLEDPEFVERIHDMFIGTDNFQYIVYELSKYSKEFSSNNEYMKQAVSVRPELISYYTGEETKDVVLQAVESMFESGNFNHYLDADFIAKQDQAVQDLLLTCVKIKELPDNAKFRKVIYKKICNHYMTKLKQTKEDSLEKGIEI